MTHHEHDPDSPEDQAITRFFQQLDPSHFAPAHSAKLPGPTDEEEMFQAFVDACLEAVPGLYERQNLPLAMLANDSTVRHFQSDPHESNIAFYRRLRHEAADMGARWFFTAQVAASALRVVDDVNIDNLDLRSSRSISDAVREGKLSENVCWYAECRQSDRAQIRIGLFLIFPDGSLGDEPMETHPDGASWMFRGVLDHSVEMTAD